MNTNELEERLLIYNLFSVSLAIPNRKIKITFAYDS
ncbi:hypothetical protein SRRS_19520 [Sporomusa rhizae]